MVTVTTLVAFVALTFGITQSAMASGNALGSAQAGQTKTYTRVLPDGKTTETVTVHAMTSAEIAAKGLSKYVGTNATAAGTLVRSKAPKAVQRGSGVVSPMASGCWGVDVWYNEPFGLKGTGHEDWCGDGTWVTYTSHWCSGEDGWYPTYAYEGCSINTSYGVGWNQEDVTWNWDLCIAWISGACAKHQHVWDSYWFGGDGNWGRYAGW